MERSPKVLITYSECRRRQKVHHLRQHEIPIESRVSLPIPTLRWNRPSYAFFAGPGHNPRDPSRGAAPPDRWWAIDAGTGRLMLYALTSTIPFPSGAQPGSIEVPEETRSVSEVVETVARIERLMDCLVRDFFSEERGYPEQKSALRDELEHHLPGPLLLPYRALAPDFFAWLENYRPPGGIESEQSP